MKIKQKDNLYLMIADYFWGLLVFKKKTAIKKPEELWHKTTENQCVLTCHTSVNQNVVVKL